MFVGVTGGIGSGKSTVAGMLGRRGAIVINADELARQALAPGSPLTTRVADEFGAEILDSEGNIDRLALAQKVFGDKKALSKLELIVHPEVARLLLERRKGLTPQDIVVYDVPLLVEKNMADQFDYVIVVEAEEKLRRERLVLRGMTMDDIEARMKNQASDDERRRFASFFLVNNDDMDVLESQVDLLWRKLQKMVH